MTKFAILVGFGFMALSGFLILIEDMLSAIYFMVMGFGILILSMINSLGRIMLILYGEEEEESANSRSSSIP